MTLYLLETDAATYPRCKAMVLPGYPQVGNTINVGFGCRFIVEEVIFDSEVTFITLKVKYKSYAKFNEKDWHALTSQAMLAENRYDDGNLICS